MAVQSTSNANYLSRTTGFANADPTTIALWCRFDALAAQFYTVWDHGNSVNFTPQLAASGTDLGLSTGDFGGNIISLGTIVASTYYWVAAVFNGTANPAIGYIGSGGNLTKVVDTHNFEGWTGTVMTLFNELDHDQTQNGEQTGLKIWSGTGGALNDDEIANEYKRFYPSKTSSLYCWIPQLNGAQAGLDISGHDRNFTATGAPATSRLMPGSTTWAGR